MFQANGIITLTTDFGLRDPFVGIMKGVILGRLPTARLVDLTHDIDKFAVASAGFWVQRCGDWFPGGTVHLAIVDPGVGSTRRMRLVQAADQLWVAPDNGLLTGLESLPAWQASRVFGLADLAMLKLAAPSNTFHGRDVFAPVVAELAAGRLLPDELGELDMSPKPDGLSASATSGKPGDMPFESSRQGQVIHIDDFGNLFTSITADQLSKIVSPQIHIAGQVIEIKRTYSDVSQGELLALVNAFGVVEIAVHCGNAREHLKATVGMPVQIRWTSG